MALQDVIYHDFMDVRIVNRGKNLCFRSLALNDHSFVFVINSSKNDQNK